MNHLHINVPDVAEARSFFERYFGFQQVFPNSATLFMQDSNEFLLALDSCQPEENLTFPEWFHFGLCRSNPDWARALYAQMAADGVHFFNELRESEHAVVFFCQGPGGYRIEVRGNKS